MLTTEEVEEDEFTTSSQEPAASSSVAQSCQEGLLFTDILYFRFYANVAVIPCLVIFGSVGNLLSIAVVSSKKVSFGFPSTTVFIRALAVADVLYLWGAILFQTLRTVQFDTEWLSVDLFAYVYPYVWPYMASVQTTETWLVVAIAVDRYIAVTCPLKAVQVCTSRRATTAVTIIVLVSVCFNVPHGLEFTTQVVNDPCTGRSSANIVATDLFLSSTYQIIYWSVLTLLIRFGLPLILLLLLTFRLLRTLQAASAIRAKLTSVTSDPRQGQRSSCNDGDQVTVLLVSVIVVFILCETIEFMMHVLTTLRWTWPTYAVWEDTSVQEHFNCLGNLLLVVGAASNFVLYCAFARRFRQQVVVLVCRRQGRRQGGSSAEGIRSVTGSTLAISEAL